MDENISGGWLVWIDSPATRKFIKITMEQFLSLAEYTFSRDITALSVAGTLPQAKGTSPPATGTAPLVK
jgi:hypothetical protein